MAREFDRTIRFRETARGEKKLAEVARHFSRKPSEILRLLIREAHARTFPKPAASPVQPDSKTKE